MMVVVLAVVVDTTKMWTLWSLAIAVAFHMGVLAQLETPPLPAELPAVPDVSETLPAVPSLGTDALAKPPALKSSSPQESSTPKKPVAGSMKGRCAPSVKYFLSSSKIDDYLQAILPPQIQELVKCEDVDLVGVLGSLLSTLANTDLLSNLDVTSMLDLGGGLGISSLLGQGGDGESSGLPILSKATGAVDEALPKSKDSLSNVFGGEKSPVGDALGDVSLPSLQKPVDDVNEKVGAIKGPAQDAVKDALPPELSSALSGLDLNDLLLGLEIQDVTMDNMESSMMGEEIHVHATWFHLYLALHSVTGPVLSALGFKVSVDVDMKIGISTNDTECINLEVLETVIKANKLTLELLETLTGSLPVPVPLPLDDLIAKLLSISLQENLEKSDSCNIVLSDFSNCKNSTGKFKYKIKNAKISPEGLFILYCVEAMFGKTSEPVIGVSLPPNPKDANSSLTLSRVLMMKFVNYVGKESSVQKDKLVANITKVTYSLQQDNTTQATYVVKIKKDGESFAKGKTLGLKQATPGCVHLPLISITTGPFFISEQFKQVNLPGRASIDTLEDVKIKLMKTNDLQAAN
ncbi:vomeromodulin-like [Perognathus longimembris pacificus]|uniref:vomeromodulin-like n=1 Tax=Perognathus longimembris pacificus TaxID=214514 RepID=UPI0020197052|nr:vomeromodulin-like [Perognathus longimembris pacificus]